jgi:hypothetical protein
MYAIRTARVAYSNIAVGAPTGPENTILGGTRIIEKVGGGSNVSVGSTEPVCSSGAPTTASSTAVAGRERILSSSGGRTTLHPRECVKSTQ